ncbi:hypothetical protein GCM10010121_070290 [Streptomyces brasiliensis]|uniref:Uncharacterized protein n=1 Tax=Streptomyces brasiliensis TaxID=1954 RepID=A0A917L740_9ACTN|nr:hypothetical protein GCM10010121_070290 [Streptomyces brasiliensis]
MAAAAAGTGFLLLSALGYALGHPETPATSALRLAWCAVPLAATVHFAAAVARTDPGTKPRPGLSAIGLGPARLMALSAFTTALATALGSLLALLVFLRLRGDLTGMPFDGATADFLASDTPLPIPATLTLLAMTPATASLTVALTLRPRDLHPTRPTAGDHAPDQPRPTAGSRTAGAAPVPQKGSTPQAAGGATDPRAPADATDSTDPGPTPGAALPWGIAALAAGLAVQAYVGHSAENPPVLPGEAAGPAGVFIGWLLTALGLVLAAPGLAHLAGRILQAGRPGALRLLAGRGLMAEATRLGRPLGILSAVASGAYAMTALYPLYHADAPVFGPLTTLGALVVAGCALATLLTTAVESRQSRADTTAALVRLGAPATMLRSAAALRAGALLAVFTPLTLVIAELAALPPTR